MMKHRMMSAWSGQDRNMLEVTPIGATGVEERNQLVHAMMTCYDKSTDCLYVQIRTLPSTCTIQIAENLWVDYGKDCKPTGYGIQNASTKAEYIGHLILGVGADRELTLEDIAQMLRNRAGDR
jgi:uncharacterized protein YuzE